jgi:hypothetical protein
MPTHIGERTITGTLEETNTWKQALNTVTGGGTPAFESKEDYQTFRWAMVENLKRIDKAIEALRLDAKSEYERILSKHCGTVERFNEYMTEAKTRMAPFSKYLLPTGVYELPGQVRARFQKTQNELSQKYPDVDKAGNEWAERQAEMFAGKISVTMICVDYTEVPDDINAGYLEFLSILILGRPLLRCEYPIIQRKQRFDKDFAAGLLSKITKEIGLGVLNDKADADIADAVMSAIFGDSAKED